MLKKGEVFKLDMCPVLLKLGQISINTYGFFLFIGFLLAVLYFRKKSNIYNFQDRFIYDFAFWVMSSGIIGARLGYVILNLTYYLENPLEIFMVWRGGLVFYGGCIFGIIAGILVVNKYKILPWQRVADIAAPAVSLAGSIGRIGCFFAGCCYGRPTESFLGVTFTRPESIAPVGIKLIPTQLIEALGNFVIFLFLNNKLKNIKFPGQVFILYFWLYSILRFIMEFLRGDDRGPVFLTFTTLQWITVGIFIFTSVILIKKFSKSSREDISGRS